MECMASEIDEIVNLTIHLIYFEWKKQLLIEFGVKSLITNYSLATKLNIKLKPQDLKEILRNMEYLVLWLIKISYQQKNGKLKLKMP